MFTFLFTALLNSVRRFAVAVKCPACGHRFKPFAEGFEDWRQIMGRFPCPECGYRFGIGDDGRKQADNPPGPFRRPDNARSERWETAEGILYHLPRSGHWGGLLPITMLWNALMLPFFYLDVIRGTMFSPSEHAPHRFIWVFTAAGVIMIYAAFRFRYAWHLLLLGPEEVRMQRIFLLRWTQKLRTRAIEAVQLIPAFTHEGGDPEAGTQVQKHTFTIEVRAGFHSLRFGTSLAAAEQHWLAWEIREYLRAHGAAELPEERARQRRG